jgi:hypothetical protein
MPDSKTETTSPAITIYAADSQFPSVARDVSVKAELHAGMTVKLTLTGENYSVTALVSREAWDDLVGEMA